MRRNDFFKSLLFSGGSAASRVELKTETLPYTFNSNSYKLRNYLRNYRIYGNTVNEESVGDLVTEGEHSGEYMVPVTVSNGTDTQTIPIYLTEQIRKVGDEAEYIDFVEQKQHRVRKNLLQNTATSQTINDVTFTVNDDGSVTCNGTATDIIYLDLNTNFNGNDFSGMNFFGYSTNPSTGSASTVQFRISAQSNRTAIQNIVSNNSTIDDVGENRRLAIRINNGYTCNNLTFYPMIRKADISDDTYEPYIEDIELDVTLPALPTLSGTNVLSVGTTVQPSKVYLQGKISEAETVSARSLQTNMQSLQPLSLDDEDLELDVMQTDNDLQLDVKPIEKPVLNLNNVSEIENAEIERGVENAE